MQWEWIFCCALAKEVLSDLRTNVWICHRQPLLCSIAAHNALFFCGFVISTY